MNMCSIARGDRVDHILHQEGTQDPFLAHVLWWHGAHSAAIDSRLEFAALVTFSMG